MTKRQSRLFFFGSTAFFALVFLALTVESHRQFPALTHEDRMSAEVLAGKEVWHAKNCTNCHTLLGEGAYFAPDLTQIAQQRGESYLRQFLKNPATFYSEEKDRRLMPNLHLSDEQISHLISFLTWVSHIDTNGWPPRPILVSGAAFAGSNVPRGEQGPVSSDPIAQGEALFRRTPPGCSGCHSTAPGVTVVGPSLAGLAGRAERTVQSPDYHGKAKTAAEYVRESIVQPSAFVVVGPTFGAAGHSFMPANFDETLKSDQIDQLVAYLMTLK